MLGTRMTGWLGGVGGHTPVALHGMALRACACWGSHKLHSTAVLSSSEE